MINPIPSLERLPGWWRGAALVRVAEANRHPANSDEHRRNMEIAATFERRAEELAA